MNSKTSVSLLQEFLAQHGKPPPQYTFCQLSGLKPEFECTVTVGDLTAIAKAYSKQEAKHKSAQQMLGVLGVTDQLTKSPVKPTVSPVNYCNSVGKLNELASQNRLPYPIYTECNSSLSPQNVQFTIKCEFGTLCAFGTANNKKEAKQMAASEMLALLTTVDMSSVFPNNSTNNNLLVTDCISTEVDNIAIRLYTELSVTLNDASKNIAHESDPIIVCPIDNLQELDTIEKLENALTVLGADWTIETFQEKPLILMLKIKQNNQVIMESGEVYEEVLFALLKRSLVTYNSTLSEKEK